MKRSPRTETEPVIAGAETIDLQEERSHGVLLLHGFGDTPQTLAGLAKRLHAAGYSVFAPLLPGHGRSMRHFRASSSAEWISAALAAFRQMREGHEAVSVVGLSMGGALAVIVAAEERDIRSLVLIAPYLGMPTKLRVAARTHWVWGRLAGEINARDPRSIRNPIERERNLAYGAVTGRALFQLLQVVNRARRALPGVRAPTLIIQSKDDPRCAPAVAEFAMKTLGAEDKAMVWAEGGHIITVDYGRERVFSEVEKWLSTHGGAKGGVRQPPGNSRAAVERLES